MRGRASALCAACLATALAGCGKASEPGPAGTPPTEGEVRGALEAHFYASAPPGQKTRPDFSVIKVVGCSKSAKEGFECDFVNAVGAKVRGRFERGSAGWTWVERIGG